MTADTLTVLPVPSMGAEDVVVWLGSLHEPAVAVVDRP